MCMKCGCGYTNGSGKFDMQPEVFDDSSRVVSGEVVVQPQPRERYNG